MCSREVKTTFPIYHHALLADCLTDHGECLLTHFPVWSDVIGIVLIQFVYLFARHELIDFYGALALDGNRFEFFWFELKIFALADLISFDDVSLAFDYKCGDSSGWGTEVDIRAALRGCCLRRRPQIGSMHPLFFGRAQF
jgi:hypothetical protein